jgi:hypothetical protein
MTRDPADLANLHDIVLPPQVSFWPPALGEQILTAALLVALLIGLTKWIAHYRRDAYRRAALRELDAIAAPFDSAAALRVSAVLKRAALVAFPREEVAPLSGGAWLVFLDRTAAPPAFTTGPPSVLPAIALGMTQDTDGEAILRAARFWIRRHRRQEGKAPC